MNNGKGNVSMGTAALITGLTLFLPIAPYAEFYVFAKLINYQDAAQTTQNLMDHPKFFLSGIFAIFFTYGIDVVLAWTMYIFLRPVNARLSLLAAWFRLVYTGLAIVLLFNFLYAFHLVNLPGIEEAYKQEHIWQLVNARRFGMHLGYIIFGLYLILVGILIYKSSYIPKVLGVLMILAGAAWMVINLQPYFFTGYNLSWLMVFSVGELIFAIWLLVKGRKIKESEVIGHN